MTEESRAAVDGAEPTPAIRRVSGDGGDGPDDASGARSEWADLTPAVRPVAREGIDALAADTAATGTADALNDDDASDTDGDTSDADDDRTAPADGWLDLAPAVRRLSTSDTDGESPEGREARDGQGAVGDLGEPDVPRDVREYARFSKIDGATYDRANEFLRDRTYITAREWAMARLCADFRTETGVEMTKIGENLPELVPFMTDTYSPQAVNQARSAFDDKVRKAGATFLYGAMCDFYTAEELDDLMYEITEVAKFLLEVEGVELTVDEELDAEERISSVMREVRESSAALRHDEFCCPNCGHQMDAATEADGAAADEPADD